MKFQIEFTPASVKDIEYFKKNEQKTILTGVHRYLSEDAEIETKRRKLLRPNLLATRELRIGDYRVFYEIEEANLVKITAVGFKVHNELFVQGRRVEL